MAQIKTVSHYSLATLSSYLKLLYQLFFIFSLGISYNRVDFELLAQEYFEQEKKHYGIIFIFAVRHSPQEIARRLLIILNNVTADEWKTRCDTFNCYFV